MANVTQLHRAKPSASPVTAYPDQEIPRYFQLALVLVSLLIGGLGGWGAIAEISGAVVASASVAAQTKTNVVQHLEGGTIAQIFIKEGDLVAAGQPLVRLDRKEVDEELGGLKAELSAKTQQLDLLNGDLASLLDLAGRGLVTRTRVSAMQREVAGITGDIGRLGAQKARVEERMKRLDIRAPLAGRVLNLALHTVGGVISPGQELMQIVPSGDRMVLEARLVPKDIDQVHPGQTVVIRLSALNQRTTPELSGNVSVVSPDLLRDEARGTQYYTARIAFDDGEIERLGGLELVPGMPAEVLIQTGSRNALSYLVKPLRDQIMRAFREE